MFSETLHCRVLVSEFLQQFNRLVHATACVVTLILALYRPYLLVLFVPICMSFRHASACIRLRRPASIRRLQWCADGRCRWQQNDEQVIQGRLIDSLVIGPHAVVLRLRPERARLRTVTLLLIADSLPTDAHRRLRARLTVRQPDEVTPDFIDSFQDRLSSLRTIIKRRR